MVVETKVKVGGLWRTITAPEVKVSGVWRAVQTIEVKSGGVWREVFALAGGPATSAAADGDANLRFGNVCYAGAQFQLDGSEWEYTNSGGLTQTGVGGDQIWMDTGPNSAIWIERIVTAGSWNSLDPGAGRHVMSTTRSFRIVRSTAGIFTVTGYFKFWDAASGGSLLQQTASATWTAERENF
ncbi:hypothetical protein LCGC14_1126310 [marine sediment metagenome]|uniref:Uncharacterized protein n=1 Tax=marine sediment metagenome TaxID=412755 RepID=A0A0F9MQF5_9ZZZZ